MMEHTSLCCEAYPQFLFNFTLPPVFKCFLLVRVASEGRELFSRKLQAEVLKVKIRLFQSGIAARKSHTANTPKRISMSYIAFQIQHD